MKHITVMDATLCRKDNTFGFKERIEIARLLERLCVDVIELPEIGDTKSDSLFVRTVSSFVKNSVLSVAAGSTAASVTDAMAALSNTKNARIRIELPVSPVGMEYRCHKKPAKMIEWITECVKTAKTQYDDVEFCAVDATRAEGDFLSQAIEAAVTAGATTVTVCDDAAEWMPDDFAAFVDEIAAKASVPVAVSCDNKNGMACAQSMLAVRKNAVGIKTAIGGAVASLETIAEVIKNCGNGYAIESGIRQTEVHRIAKQIGWISDKTQATRAAVVNTAVEEQSVRLDTNDSQADVIAAVAKLGYDLSEEDQARVYEEFLRVAEKKTVGAKELEAVVASTALQVPATYKLINYVVNSGNVISASAQLTLERDGKALQGVCMGDGPINAAFRAIDQLTGCHYELDDFQIQSVTEGTEAMGSALVKLRADGKLYAGNGISTDIIGASIRAYLNAVNKIVYEEA